MHIPTARKKCSAMSDPDACSCIEYLSSRARKEDYQYSLVYGNILLGPVENASINYPKGTLANTMGLNFTKSC
jgi:hypothetical protein